MILTPRDIALDGEGASSWTDPLDPIFSVRFGCSVFSDSCQFWLLPSARARAFDLDFSPHARVVFARYPLRVRCMLGLPGDPAARPRRARACCGRAEGASGAPTYGLLYTFFSISFYRFTDYRTAYRTRISMQAHLHMDYSSSCCRLFFSVRVFYTRTCHVVKSKLKPLMQTLKVLYSMESCTRLAPAPRHEAPSSPTWSAPHHASTWCPCPTFAWTCWCNCSCSCDTPCLQARTRNSAS